MPEETAAASIVSGDAHRLMMKQDVAFQWPQAFASAALNSLVEEAFRDVDYLTDLGTEAAYRQALLRVTQARTTRFGDTATPYQALGGGW